MVLSPNCTSHHAGNTPSGGLDMSTQAKAWTNLVGASATTVTGCTGERVMANNAAMSVLYQVVSEATPCGGSQMPKGGTPLSAADQTMIEDWINGGALNN
jgi:hypothetical protein